MLRLTLAIPAILLVIFRLVKITSLKKINHKSGLSQITSLDFPKSQVSYKKNHTNRIILSESSYPINQEQRPTDQNTEQEADRIDKIDYLKKLEEVRERVSSEYILSLKNSNGIPCYDPEEMDELIELIAWAELSSQTKIMVNGEYIDTELIRIRFAKLSEEHIQYVLDCLKQNKAKINKRRSYLMTCLYNAPSSLSGYYSNLVNHDFSP